MTFTLFETAKRVQHFHLWTSNQPVSSNWQTIPWHHVERLLSINFFSTWFKKSTEIRQHCSKTLLGCSHCSCSTVFGFLRRFVSRSRENVLVQSPCVYGLFPIYVVTSYSWKQSDVIERDNGNTWGTQHYSRVWREIFSFTTSIKTNIIDWYS